MKIPSLSPYHAGLIFSAVRLIPSSFSFIYLLGAGLSVADVSNARLIQILALLALEVPCGVLADRFSPRWSIFMAALASAFWLGVMAVVDNLPTLIVAELLNAISLSLFSGSFEMLLRDTHQAKNPLANFGKAQALWIAVASAFGALFASVVSRQAAWILAAVIQSLLFVILWYDARRHRPTTPSDLEAISLQGIVSLRVVFRTIQSLPISLWITFTAPTLVLDILLQFWQPIVVVFGIQSENNLLLLLISLAIMVAMSMGGALEEMPARCWVIPVSVALTPLLVITMLLTVSITRLAIALVVISLLIILSTALRSRAAFQITRSVHGDAEVTAFSLVSAISRVFSGLLIVTVGAFLSTAFSVALIFFAFTGLIVVCCLYWAHLGMRNQN